MVEDMRRELAGEETPSDAEEEADVGRRSFGVAKSKDQETAMRRSDSQEPFYSDEECGSVEVKTHAADNSSNVAPGLSRNQRTKGPSKPLSLPTPKTRQDNSSEGGAWSKVVSKQTTISNAEATKRRHARNNAIDVEDLDVSQAALITTKTKPKKNSKKSSMLEVSSDESGDEDSAQLPFAIRAQELIKRAFAGADVVGEFEAEKKQTIEDEDEKTIDNTLPGWGSWLGDGLSKKERARNKGRFLTKTEGIKEQNRKDVKLDRVIINEKRVKKVSPPLRRFPL
jgi:U3 small nucleolar RNA-associated protein 14